MIGETNVNGGAGLNGKGALICVKAPVESTLTFTKNDIVAKILYPKDSHVILNDEDNANYYFTVVPNNYGEWIITATKGSDTASESVSVTTNEKYDVEILYNYWLYHHGNEMESLTGGYTAVAWRYTDQSWGAAAPTMTKNTDSVSITYPRQANAVFRTVNAVDVTNFTTLKAIVDCTPLATTDNNIIFCLLKNTTTTYWGNQMAAQTQLQKNRWTSGVTNTTISLDISGVTGAKWIALGSNYGYEYTITFHDIWLE